MRIIWIIPFIFSATLLAQPKYEGIWVAKEDKALTFPDTSLWGGEFAMFLQLNPHMIQWDNYNLILIYGDIMDPKDSVIAKSRGLYSFEGDCVFAWEPSSSMYEYVATWVDDHFVYYFEETAIIYERLDPDLLSQDQKDRMVPIDEMALYFQGRLDPVYSHYHCNVPEKK